MLVFLFFIFRYFVNSFILWRHIIHIYTELSPKQVIIILASFINIFIIFWVFNITSTNIFFFKCQPIKVIYGFIMFFLVTFCNFFDSVSIESWVTSAILFSRIFSSFLIRTKWEKLSKSAMISLKMRIWAFIDLMAFRLARETWKIDEWIVIIKI